MKFNMGCGLNYLDGYTNIDKFPHVNARVMDLEKFPWNLGTNSADEVLFNHSLEHMGRDPDVFCRIMAEVYHLCKPNAEVHINVPFYRHDHFWGDPTHVRAITPDTFHLFSKKNCQEWQKLGASNTPLAFYYHVDFEVFNVEYVVDPTFAAAAKEAGWEETEIAKRFLNLFNVVAELRIKLRVIK